MANYPMIIPKIYENNYLVINYNGSSITLKNNKEIIINGNLKDAAIGLFKYIVESNFYKMCIRIEINGTICISFKDNIKITLTDPKKEPTQWKELVHEFDRIVKMKLFF